MLCRGEPTSSRLGRQGVGARSIRRQFQRSIALASAGGSVPASGSIARFQIATAELAPITVPWAVCTKQRPVSSLSIRWFRLSPCCSGSEAGFEMVWFGTFVQVLIQPILIDHGANSGFGGPNPTDAATELGQL